MGEVKCLPNIYEWRTLTPEEAAYTAGFLDGEGSLMLGREKRRGGNRSGLRYTPKMEASNTHLGALERIRARMGAGRITGYHVQHGRRLPLYKLQLTPKQIEFLLPQLLPYLIVKREQADALLTYFQWVKPRGRQSREQADSLHALYWQMRGLNRRGREIAPEAFGEVWHPRPRPPLGICTAQDCVRRAVGRGLCLLHWKRERGRQMREGTWQPLGRGGRPSKRV